MKKRLAILIAAAMLVTSMPFYAFAVDEVPAESTTTGAETTEETVETAQEEADPNGWNEDKTEYYKNGKKLTNVVQKIGNKYYYFNNKGKVTKYTDKWRTINGEKYRFNANGNIVTKPTYVKNSKGKKVLYMFRTNGKLLVKKEGVFKYNGKEYYSLGNGKLKTGWVAFKENKKLKAAYFNEKNSKKYGTLGSMAKDTTIKYLKVPKSGRLGEAYYYGVKKLDSTDWTLRQAYKNSYRLRYYGRWYRTSSSEKYSLRGFKTGGGNCYVMAATFYIQAKLLGYDIHQVQGKVGIWPHSWTVIRQNGKEWVYDPNFRNETGRNGWKIYYGKRGTWRYSKMKKMN